ncbi:MAG: hypothetical protein SGBAC_008688 [Bacillariaceae sp.]
MKFLLASLVSALSAQGASAAFFSSEVSGMSDVGSGPSVKYDYDMEVPGTASKKCALVNIVMDESGSMTTEQTFLKQTAIPDIVSELYTATYGYTDVFICSNGFGGYDNTDVYDYRHVGCTRGLPNGSLGDTTITDWNVRGHWEEGYYAMSKSMENVPQVIDSVNLNTECSELHKNLILVSDEDRDAENWATTPTTMRQEIIDHGYILNIVVDSTINADLNNVGIQVNSVNRNTIFRADGSGGFSSFDKNENFVTFVAHEDLGVYTLDHYYPLIIGTGGAAWNVNSLREGAANNANLKLSFADAFVKTKVQEIVDNCSGNTCGGGGRSEIGGDPHITTWKNEHYEYHGQCDLVMMKDDEFADGLGLDIHIRTKVVRHWSYIQSIAIRIGNDVIEIEGSADREDQEAHYWYNYEYQGEPEGLGGFKLIFKKQVAYKRQYIVDLSPKYPGKDIVIQLFKEFIRVKFNGSEEAFGKTAGLMGDFKTGKTLGRDGVTELNDYTALGEDWQVLPADGNLFHVATYPQFPEKCVEPEDPRGERRRRLGESKLTYEQAEAACFHALSDPLSIKDCVYDVLATQDLDMVGAF